MTGWTTVVVEVAAPQGELAADALWGAGAPAIEEQDAGEGRVRLLAGYPTPDEAEAAASAARALGWTVTAVVPVGDDGLDGWRAFARPERAGRVVLVPAWVDAPEPRPGDLTVTLDPGATFGSGSHPTTRLVAAAAAELVDPGAAVLDVGSGSGVLAVVAALAGAASVIALDVDPAAADVVTANAVRNGVADRIRFDARPLSELAASGATFDLVLANLLAPVVIDLAPPLVSVLAPGGRLVVSGLLADRWQTATARLAGLVVIEVERDEGWVAVTLGQQGAGGAPP